MRTLNQNNYIKFFLWISFTLFIASCRQDDFSFNYSSKNTPGGSISFDSDQTVYTTNRNINLKLATTKSYEMNFFVNKSCIYKEATSWEAFSETKQLQLPDVDGYYKISVMYRTADHFPSECQTVDVVLDRAGPTPPTQVTLDSRISTTLNSPSFSFDAGKDLFSDVVKYQARLVSVETTPIEVITWTDVGTFPQTVSSMTAALASGTAYVIEVRAQDKTGNYGPSKSSLPFYAGLTFDVTYVDSSSIAHSCIDEICTMKTGVYEFKIKPSFILPEGITIDYYTEDFTALAGLDYFSASGSVYLPPGGNLGDVYAPALVNVRDSFQPGEQRSFKLKFKSNLSSTQKVASIYNQLFDNLTRVASSTVPSFVNFSLGIGISTGLTSNNEVYTWSSSQIAGVETHLGFKVSGLNGDQILQIKSGSEQACALTDSKVVKCWGDVSLGGFLSRTDYSTATAINDFTDIKQFTMSTIVNADLQEQIDNLRDFSTKDNGFLCGVHSNGQVRCAGRNKKYQLGNGNNSVSSSSSLVTGLSVVGVDPVVKKVTAYSDSVCALTTAGEVYCWGSNERGQLGISLTTTFLAAATKINSLPEAKDLEVGDKHACIISFDDRLYCWGDNTYGQLGLAITTTYSTTPVEISGQNGVKSISIAKETNCLVKPVSGVDKVFCWGKNYYVGLGQNNWGFYLTPTLKENYPGIPLSLSVLNFSSTELACTVNTIGKIYCWGGAPFYGAAIGIPSLNYVTKIINGSNFFPQNSQFNMNTKDITLQNFTFCRVDNQDKYYCNGLNPITSPLMTLSNTHTIEPELITNASIKSLAVGKYGEFFCYVDQNKKLFCKGNNEYGQLGNGTTNESTVFSQVGSFSNVNTVVAGAYHVCILTESNLVYCWGRNHKGQVSLTPVSPYIVSTPSLVSNLPAGQITKLVGNGNHSCVLMSTGAVYCWGRGDHGQLGDGTNTAIQSTPVQVLSSEVFKDIQAGYNANCAISTNNQIFCWGYNLDGNLGIGTTVNVTVPTPIVVPAGKNFVSFSVSNAGICAISNLGEVYCAGYGAGGALGSGSSSSSSVPIKVLNIAGGVVKVVSGFYWNLAGTSNGWYSCALIQLNGVNQDVKCWGNSGVITGVPGSGSATPIQLFIDSTSP